MKEIKLTKDRITLVDDEDFEYLNQWKWQIISGYVARCIKVSKTKSKTVLMARLIMGEPKDFWIDHKDRNKLNNCKSNLRICNGEQNRANSEKRNLSSSKYKGVIYRPHYNASSPWVARIKGKHIGYYKKEEEAAMAYNQKAIELFGEFACINPL